MFVVSMAPPPPAPRKAGEPNNDPANGTLHKGLTWLDVDHGMLLFIGLGFRGRSLIT